MDLSILGAVFARPPAPQQQNMFSNTQSLNEFAVSIKNYHPFDMQLLPFVIFKNVHTGETYAFPYLVFNLGATIAPGASFINNMAQALALGGLLRVNGNKTLGIKEARNSIILGKEAPPKGLEPLTDWLTASRSTGLSYGGTA